MNRVLVAITLSMWVVFMGLISYGLGDYKYPFETWIISFSLPLWSLMTIGLWYDTGRLLVGTLIDNKESTLPNWIRGLSFVVWMSLVLTYIVSVHVDLQSIPMLLVIPILGIPLRDWLVRNWGEFELPTRQEVITWLVWSIISYITYWVLMFAWIILRVYAYDVTGEGFVFYIQ